jgi:uncharacterized protein YndB with AHSA1/START domain
MNSPFVDALVVRRKFRASLDRVFRAWSDPILLQQWLGGRQDTALATQVDFREGGMYHLDVRTPTGDIIHLSGTYQEIDSPHRLVFTWGMGENYSATDATLVTVEFLEKDGQTEIMLKHERFRDMPTREFHAGGWDLCFARLDTLFE